MNSSRCFKSLPLVKSALIILALCLVGCGKTKHTIQQDGNEGISLGNGEYLFPDKKGELLSGPLNHLNGQPPAGTVIIIPKTKEDVIKWLDRIGVKHDVKQEVKKP